MISYVPLLCFLAAAIFLRFFFNAFSRILVERRFTRLHGCQPAARVPSKGLSRHLSLGQIVSSIKATKQHRSLDRLHGFFRYGNTLDKKRFGQPIIVTREPQNIKTILSLKFQDYKVGHRIDAQGPLLGHGIFTSDGDHWAQSRALIRPNFVREQVADLALFEEMMGDFFALLPTDGSTVDLQHLFFSYAMDSATEFLFGHSIHSLRNSLRARDGVDDQKQAHEQDSDQEVADAFNYAMGAISMRSKLGFLRIFYWDRKATQSFRVCHRFADRYVDQAVKIQEKMNTTGDNEGGMKGTYFVLHELARQTSDRRRIRDELINVFIAGRDTTAGLLSNMFFMLARKPEIWAKLRAEVEMTLEGRLPTYDELRSMKYLKYCMNESLRLHPVVPINSRVAKTDTFLPLGGGPDGQSPVFVPKGAFVVYSVYSMHRREDIYGDDANEFRPERWESIRPGWEYLPFNGGPRICLGQQYALTEAGYVTVRMAQKFRKLESRDERPWEESLALTLKSRNGTKVSLVAA